jgi:ATPase subunit of ABC transporter with duplicated ATPase domains
MSVLEIKKISFSYGQEQLFKHAEARLFQDDHTVLVGPNGAGKSTLMKMLAKELSPDEGAIEWLPHIKVGYLDQFLKLPKNMSVEVYLHDAFQSLFDLESKMLHYYESASHVDHDAAMTLMHYAQDIQEQLEDKDFYHIKSKVDNVISGLGLSEHVLTQTLETLSGGMKAKVMLAKLLLDEYDVLLLDEPTNFLDVRHIDFLANYLINFPKAFLVISHDELFLNKIAKTVLAIEGVTIERYKGNFEFYLKERDIRQQLQQKSFSEQQQKIKKEEAFIQKNIVRASTTKRAQSRRKMLNKIVRIAPPKKRRTYSFSFPFSGRTGEKVLSIHELLIGYETPLLEPITQLIRRQQKVAIIGKNGIGKTTLLKTIMNEIHSLGGTYDWIDTSKIAYYAQVYESTSQHTAYQYLRSFYPDEDDKFIYQMLGSYGLTYDMAHRPLQTLSGGEQTKMRLAVMKQQKSNVLILDEPTNHLDEDAKNALIEALQVYEGTLIIVSHEIPFYEAVCDEVIELYQ